jgi:hypothetical protein
LLERRANKKPLSTILQKLRSKLEKIGPKGRPLNPLWGKGFRGERWKKLILILRQRILVYMTATSASIGENLILIFENPDLQLSNWMRAIKSRV